MTLITSTRTLLTGLVLTAMTHHGCHAPEPTDDGSSDASSDGPSDASSDASTGAWFDDRRWSNRLVVFTDVDPGADRQQRLLEGREAGLEDRDLLVVGVAGRTATLLAGTAPTLPSGTAFANRFQLPGDRFQMVLVGKDGRVKRRRDEPMPPEELWSIIDAMPMRQDEMRRGRD